MRLRTYILLILAGPVVLGSLWFLGKERTRQLESTQPVPHDRLDGFGGHPSQERGDRESSTAKRLAAHRSQSKPRAEASTASGNLGIRSEELEDARKTVAEITANGDHYRMILGDEDYARKSTGTLDLSRKLASRLRLDASIAQKVEKIIQSDLAEQVAGRIEASRTEIDLEIRTAERDPEAFARYLALTRMVTRGESIEGHQKDFIANFRVNNGMDAEPSEPTQIVAWYESTEVLLSLNETLSEDARTALASYIAELREREGEIRRTHLLMRSHLIAERLGLDDEERAAIHDFLQQNPNASRSELASIISPELRDLLPEGN